MSDGKRRGTGLTDDDEAVWSHVARSVQPMRAKRSRLPAGEDLVDQRRIEASSSRAGVDEPAATDLSPLGQFSAGKSRWQPLVARPTPRPTAVPSAHAFDKRHARKIASGRVEIEGRIDLHGMREHEAHIRLRGFLRQAHAQGKRTVLVITGKGRDDVDAHAPFDFGHDRSARGVLKRNVPRWLAEPDLAPIVVSFTIAHVRHGGEGALYVHLRRS